MRTIEPDPNEVSPVCAPTFPGLSRVAAGIVSHNYFVVEANELFAEIYDRTINTLSGASLWDILSSDQRLILEPVLRNVQESGEPIKQVISYNRGQGHSDSRKQAEFWLATYYPVNATENSRPDIIILQVRMSVEECDSYVTAQKTHVLTKSERQILHHLSAGRTSKEIAQLIKLSPLTINVHRKHICRKLNLHSTAELVAWAASLGESL